MKIIVNQPWGLGDVVFCQTLAQKIAEGREIIWPVMSHFVEGLNRAYPRITFVDMKSAGIDFDRRDQYEILHPSFGLCTVLPFRWAVENMKLPYKDCMKSKYLMYGMDFEIWRGDARWKRDMSHEGLLYDDRTIIAFASNGGGNYTFSNDIFGSECKMKVPIPECGVKMEVLPHSSLFDWASIIQDAAAIHTVSTSIIYLLEMLDLRAPEVHLYNRPIKGQGFDNIDYLLKRHKYVFHE